MTQKNQLHGPPESPFWAQKPLRVSDLVGGALHVVGTPRQQPTTMNNNSDTAGTYNNPPASPLWPKANYPLGLIRLVRIFVPNKVSLYDFETGSGSPDPSGLTVDGGPSLFVTFFGGPDNPHKYAQWVDPGHDIWLPACQGIQAAVETNPDVYLDVWEYSRKPNGTPTTTAGYCPAGYHIAATLPPSADWGSAQLIGVDCLNVLIERPLTNTFQAAYVSSGSPTLAYGTDETGLGQCFPAFRRHATFVYVDNGSMTNWFAGQDFPMPTGYVGDWEADQVQPARNLIGTEYSTQASNEATWVQGAIAGTGVFVGRTPLSTYNWAYKGNVDWNAAGAGAAQILADIKAHWGLP